MNKTTSDYIREQLKLGNANVAQDVHRIVGIQIELCEEETAKIDANLQAEVDKYAAGEVREKVEQYLLTEGWSEAAIKKYLP